MSDPPLPHLAGNKSETAPVMDPNTAHFTMGLAVFLFFVTLFLWKTAFDMWRSNNGWTWEVLAVAVVNIVIQGVCVQMFYGGWQALAKARRRLAAKDTDHVLSGELSGTYLGDKNKPKPLATAACLFVGFLVQAAFGAWIGLTTKHLAMSLPTILFEAFTCLCFLGGSVWAFRWWLRLRNEGRD